MPPRFPAARAFTALPINGSASPAAPAPAPAHAPRERFHSSSSASSAAVRATASGSGSGSASRSGSGQSSSSSSRLPPTYPLQRCARRPSPSALGTGTSPAAGTRAFHATAPSRASAKDPYEVLGVKKDAAAGEIKKKYYQLAKKWHPDSNSEKGANERFVEIQAAYDILSDDKKRQAYDRYGSASTQEGFDPDAFARGAGGFGGFQDFGSAFGGRAGNAGDLFEQLFGGAFGGGGGGGAGGAGGGPFGGGAQRQRMQRGDDVETTVNLSFMDAANGVKRTINITPVVDCKPCTGSGLKVGKSKTTCATCRGTGQQTFQVSGMLMASTCQACGGAGSSIPSDARCGECAGLGRVKEKKPVEVDIPAGVDDGMKVKMPGLGDMPLGAQGPPGDLYVRVKVAKSADFRRVGTHLYHDARVPLHTALLGGRVRIPTLEGDVEVRVREGTQHAQEAVLKGRGMRDVYASRGRADRGDLIVSWQIQIPRSLSPLQKRLIQAYGETVDGKTPEVHFGPLPAAASSEPVSEPAPGGASGKPTTSEAANNTSSTSSDKVHSHSGSASGRTAATAAAAEATEAGGAGVDAQQTGAAKEGAGQVGKEAQAPDADGGESEGEREDREEKKRATG